MSNDKLIYPELSYEICGILFKTQNKLGRFCREKQYCDELEKLFKEKGISFTREKTDGNSNRFDFLLEGKIVLEVKAKPFVTKEDYYQTSRYLEINNIKLGLLVNFRSSYLKPKRIINAKYSRD